MDSAAAVAIPRLRVQSRRGARAVEPETGQPAAIRRCNAMGAAGGAGQQVGARLVGGLGREGSPLEIHAQLSHLAAVHAGPLGSLRAVRRVPHA